MPHHYFRSVFQFQVLQFKNKVLWGNVRYMYRS